LTVQVAWHIAKRIPNSIFFYAQKQKTSVITPACVLLSSNAVIIPASNLMLKLYIKISVPPVRPLWGPFPLGNPNAAN
jgi:hypothetical protein